jgi:hypothetical protein
MITIRFAILLLFGLAITSQGSDFRVRQIPVPSGPEDIALDTAHPSPRLIVSSTDRLAKKSGLGALGFIDFKTLSYTPFEIPGFVPQQHLPHGISFVPKPQHSGLPYLYVIEHPQKGTKSKEQIVRYTVTGGSLLCRTALPESPLLTNPNDLVAAPDGRVFATNNPKALLSGFFSGGDVLAYHPSTNAWTSLVTNRYRYSNGIRLEGEAITVSTVFSAHLDTISAITGEPLLHHWKSAFPLDNISPDQGPATHLYLTGVHNVLKLGGASRSYKKNSATSILRVSAHTTGNPVVETAVDDKGEPILLDAASVCLEHQGRLFVGHIFKPWVTMVEGHRWKLAPRS